MKMNSVAHFTFRRVRNGPGQIRFSNVMKNIMLLYPENVDKHHVYNTI